jgi:hypothetical protein
MVGLETDLYGGIRGVVLDDRTDRAYRAVKAFRKLQPTLTAYARVLTGNPNVRVEMSATNNGATDGTRIFYRPPIELGDPTPHVRMLCDKRNSKQQMLCRACRVRERILVIIIHEIAHIAFDSFAMPSESDKAELIAEAVRGMKSRYAEMITERIAKAPYWRKRDYKNLVSLVSKFLPVIVNALEDARVNRKMFEVRPGTKVMFQADVENVFEEGVEQKGPDGRTVRIKWSEYSLNNQAIIGLFCLASGYDYRGSHWFVPPVERALDDETLRRLVGKLSTVRDVRGVFYLSFPILARLRELGFCIEPTDPEEPSEPEPEEDRSDSEESGKGDSSDAGDSGSGDGSDSKDDLDESTGSSDNSDGEETGSVGGTPDDNDSGSSSTDGAGNSEGTDPSSEGEDVDDSESSDNDATRDDSGPGDTDCNSGSSADDDKSSETPQAGGARDGDSNDSGREDNNPSSKEEAVNSEAEASSDGVQRDDPGDDSDSDSPSEGESEAPSPDDGRSDDGSGSGVSEQGGASVGPSDSDSEQSNDRDADGSGGLESSRVPEWDADDIDPAEASSNDRGSVDGESEGTDTGETDSESNAEPDDDGAPRAGGETNESPQNSESADASSDSASDGTSDASRQDQPGGERVDEGSSGDSGDASPTESHEEPVASTTDHSEDEEDTTPLDTGADPGEGGVSLLEPEEPDYEAELGMGTPDDANEALIKWGGHGEKPHSLEAIRDEGAVDKAIVQEMYFETPSRNIYGVREHFYDRPILISRGNLSLGWDKTRFTGRAAQLRAGVAGDFEPPESILGPALLQMRIAFANNARGAVQRHRKSGKIDGKVLGKRAGLGDERLFKKKHLPGKRDYFVLIRLDISSSTKGLNLMLLKRAALAQAILLHRTGVKFAIYADTGAPHFNLETGQAQTSYDLDVYHVKDPDEPWTDAIKSRLENLCPTAANLDGHALEFYRKVLDKRSETNRIIMLYSDGKMPAENYDEELGILQREIAICRKNKYTLLGVGIRTDSPARHGLDTVQVDTDDDLKKVVTHLKKRLVITPL